MTPHIYLIIKPGWFNSRRDLSRETLKLRVIILTGYTAVPRYDTRSGIAYDIWCLCLHFEHNYWCLTDRIGTYWAIEMGGSAVNRILFFTCGAVMWTHALIVSVTYPCVYCVVVSLMFWLIIKELVISYNKSNEGDTFMLTCLNSYVRPDVEQNTIMLKARGG